MDLKRNIKGQILLMSALMMPVLIFVSALALDVGFLFDQRRRQQIAADAGAEAAGIELYRSATTPLGTLETVARFDTALNGFTHGADGVTVTVNKPPTMGDFAGNNNFVEVIVTRPTPTFFMGILGPSSMTVGASAVSGTGSSSGCLYALDTTPGVKSIEIANTKRVHADNCEAYGNANLFVDGRLWIDKVNVYGVEEGAGFVNDVSVMTSADVITNMRPAVADPLDYLAFPAGECPSFASDLILTGTVTVPSPPGGYGCWNKIIVNNAGTNVTFSPGRYHAKDGIFFNGSTTVTAPSATFVTHNDKIEIAGNATLTAPTTGTYAGILMFVNKTIDKDIEIKNTSVTNLTGTIYSKRGKILYSGISSGTITYSILVAGRIMFTDSGDVYFNNDFSALPAGSPVRRPTLAD